MQPFSPVLGWSLAALAGVMAVLFVLGVRDAGRVLGERPESRRRWTVWGALIAAAYLGVSAALALSGALADLDARPPPVGLFLIGTGLATVVLAFSRVGDRLLHWPLAVLVGVQAFRVLLELILLAAARDGTLPFEMTFEGWNLDVVTGLTALVLALWLARGSPPRAVVLAWNVLGVALLVVVVAIASTSAFGVIETSPRVTVPAAWPGVWIPAWLVQLALLGHLLVFRKLRQPAPGL